jgi:molybdopterin molybdotransferase
VLTVSEARDRILAAVRPLPAENVSIEDARGRVLAETIVASRDVPPFANSAMDGYAVRVEDIRDAGPQRPVRLPVRGEIRAGDAPAGPLPGGAVFRIMTGAPIPAGSNAVVRLEDTAESDGVVDIRVSVDEGTSIRKAGSDIHQGDRIADAGHILTPGLIGVIASSGLDRVPCVRAPRVLLLSTGDELRTATDKLEPGQIVNTNRYTLRAAMEEAGAVVIDAGVARDDIADLARKLRRAQSADLVVTTGGVSMGAYDLVREVVSKQGAIDFWQVAVRPGKPLAFGKIQGVPLIGLPGNPVSALVGFELFVRPALLRMQGRSLLERPRRTARLDVELESPPHLEQYFRGIAREQKDGTLQVSLTGDQGSHVLRSMADANCLIPMPAGTGRLRAGSVVEVIMLSEAQPPATRGAEQPR